MKKIILVFFITFLIITDGIGQNIQLRYEGQLLEHGDEIIMTGQADLFDMAIDLEVKNNTQNTASISCRRYELDTITMSALYMCWANCTVLPFGGTVVLEPQETSDLFSAHINPNGHFGVERNLYTFYNEQNPADSMSFIAVFTTTNFVPVDEAGEPMIHQSVEFWGTPNAAIGYDGLKISNLSVNDLEILVEQEIVELADGAEVSFQWGGLTYHELSEPVNLPALSLDSSFAVDYQAGSELGISIIKYHFFEESNPENAHQLTLIFNTTSVGLVETKLESFRVYPNPSHGMVRFGKVGENQPYSELLIFGVDGKLVFQQMLQSNTESIDFVLPKGLYMYQFLSHDSQTRGRKLIVL